MAPVGGISCVRVRDDVGAARGGAPEDCQGVATGTRSLRSGFGGGSVGEVLSSAD